MSLIGPVDPEASFDYKVVKEAMNSLMAATGYKLEREWPARYQHVDSSMVVVLTLVRYGLNVFTTITYLAKDEPKDQAAPPILSLSIPPLSRTLLEVVISLIFLLEDLPRNTRWFFHAAWREKKELITKANARYSGKPRWDQY